MPIKVAAFTPLPMMWPYPLCSVARGIRVIEKPKFKEDNWDFWNLRRTEREEVLDRSHWFCLEAEYEWHDHNVQSRLAMDLRNAMLGFQLWCITGWDGLIVSAELAEAGGATVATIQFPEPYPMSRLSKMISLGTLDTTKLPSLVEGTMAALESSVVRVKNPFQFLEIGLQTAFNHPRAGALLWITGLDALLGAESQDLFASRLIRLLGEETPVFPEDGIGRRPRYTVGEVAANMYRWRNLIAHGKQILEKYRQRIEFQFESPEMAYLSVEDWTYEELLFEASLFTLTAALRKVITDGQFELLADKRQWERWLDSSAS